MYYIIQFSGRIINGIQYFHPFLNTIYSWGNFLGLGTLGHSTQFFFELKLNTTSTPSVIKKI